MTVHPNRKIRRLLGIGAPLVLAVSFMACGDDAEPVDSGPAAADEAPAVRTPVSAEQLYRQAQLRFRASLPQTADAIEQWLEDRAQQAVEDRAG